jgi:hypothetical protein
MYLMVDVTLLQQTLEHPCLIYAMIRPLLENMPQMSQPRYRTSMQKNFARLLSGRLSRCWWRTQKSLRYGSREL